MKGAAARLLAVSIVVDQLVNPLRAVLASPPAPRFTSTLTAPVTLRGIQPKGVTRLHLVRPGIAVANTLKPFRDGEWAASGKLNRLPTFEQQSFVLWLKQIFDRMEQSPAGRSLLAALAAAPTAGESSQSWSSTEHVSVVIFRESAALRPLQSTRRAPWSHEPVDPEAATTGSGCVSSLTVPDGVLRGYRALDGMERLEAPELSVADLLIRSWHSSFGALASPHAHTDLEGTLAPHPAGLHEDPSHPWGVRPVPDEDIFVNGEPLALRSAFAQARGNSTDPSPYAGFTANPYVASALARNGLPPEREVARIHALIEPPTVWKLAHQLGVLAPPLVGAPLAGPREQAGTPPVTANPWLPTTSWRRRDATRLVRSWISDWDLTSPVRLDRYGRAPFVTGIVSFRRAPFAEVHGLRQQRLRATTLGSPLTDLTFSIPPSMRVELVKLSLAVDAPVHGPSTSRDGC